MPVKRIQSFEFYGADAQPTPARKGIEWGGVARTHGRGVSEGGYTWTILYDPMFLLAPMSPVVKWSASWADVSKDRGSDLGQVEKKPL